MKVLQKLLKQQREELKQKGSTSVDIIGHHKKFMELVKSLDILMCEMEGEHKLQPTTVKQPQPTTSKATTSHADPMKSTYEVIHGKARYRCPQCKHQNE